MPYTLRLPTGNRTTDKEICVLSTLEQRIVITKDADLTQSHY
jgi:predicted nuclease of predicted toxin-antitoxin system